MVDDETVRSLEDLRRSGRRLVLVTGRELGDLLNICPHLYLFDRVVAENGALLYRPATKEEKILSESVPKEFIQRLISKGAQDVSAGRAIVSTWIPCESAALDLIKEMGLDLQVVFNREAVMVLPAGVNKATGLAAALQELDLSFHNVVGIGDAENDHAFLAKCECSAAVANALEAVKQRVDRVMPGSYGEGVAQLVREIIASDLAEFGERPGRSIAIGRQSNGAALTIKPYGMNVLISGSSGGGKSTVATAFLEALADLEYQFVIVDPEGDYSKFDRAVALGDEKRPPSISEVMDLLAKPARNAVVNLVGLPLKERPKFIDELFPHLHGLRVKTGRPHWIVFDEAHHVLPSAGESTSLTVSQNIYGMMLITLEPGRITPTILSAVNLVLALGDEPDAILAGFSEAVKRPKPPPTHVTLQQGEAVAWFCEGHNQPVWIRTELPRGERRRHRRKYFEGELEPERSFYFRGPGDKLNLRAQNLAIFLQIADGVDDETWLYHLRSGHFARWFREVIKDPELAAEVEQIQDEWEAKDSRSWVRAGIEKRYVVGT